MRALGLGIQVFLNERRRILFGVLVTGLLAGFGWLVLRPHEPVFQGKPLSFWLQQAYRRVVYDLALPSPEAARAVSAIGSDAVPQLVRMAAAGSSVERRILVNFAREFAFLHLPIQESENELAVWGFKVLGPKGKPGVPALVRLLDDKDPLVRVNAARALGGVGPAAQEAVPALVAILRRDIGPQGQDFALREAAAGALGEMGTAALPAIPHLAALTNAPAAELALIKLRGNSFLPFIARLKDTSNPTQWVQSARLVADLGTNADAAIPLLVAALNSTNRAIPEHALYALARIQRQPDVCIPALTPLLDSPDPNIRYQSLVALTAFGAEAKPAVPDITRLIHRSGKWLWVQWEATNALGVIDPEAAAGLRLNPAP